MKMGEPQGIAEPGDTFLKIEHLQPDMHFVNLIVRVWDIELLADRLPVSQ